MQGEVVGLLAFVIGYLLKDRFLFFFNNLKKKKSRLKSREGAGEDVEGDRWRNGIAKGMREEKIKQRVLKRFQP